MRDVLRVSAQHSVREVNDLSEMRHQEGEVLQRWEKPTLTEAYCIEAWYFKTFLLRDFCTRSHKYCHFQLQSCFAAGGLTQKEDAIEELSRIPAALALSVHCVPGHQRGSGPG